MGGIEHVAHDIGAVLHERLPWQRKTQRENLALLVATMLSERSANLMALGSERDGVQHDYRPERQHCA